MLQEALSQQLEEEYMKNITVILLPRSIKDVEMILTFAKNLTGAACEYCPDKLACDAKKDKCCIMGERISKIAHLLCYEEEGRSKVYGTI